MSSILVAIKLIIAVVNKEKSHNILTLHHTKALKRA